MRERNALLGELPPADLKAYLRWELLRRMTAYLTPAFIGPNKAFTEAMYGKIDTPPRNRLVAVEVETALGHPLGQLYVAKYFSPETRKAAEELVQRSRPSSADASPGARGSRRRRAAKRSRRSTR